ncbi:PREDICTED: aminopeptidase N [Bactrocera latifrons]|uniref:Aminopeptidase N n=1 Tax=Bactrocera latifrons TaxID=174628 RepID=A0A0K8UB09_BACLA|nr:PREDICTED: aminopeptidase N [Bactrocera latifrons]XP_018791451.1 PREDICTED: aminopeptidase N [Bactrocera latifrons]XP_018791452.1 PREDICTED: aminopeptidase N [Bactrocera latifrons]
MVLKDIHVRENINMDNHRTTTTLNNTPPTTTFTTRRGYTFSGTTLFLIAACFVCTLLAVSFIIYNVATCEQQLTPLPDEEVICTTVKKHILKPSSTSDEAKERIHYERDVRLPISLKPQKYNITIVPYLLNNNFTFEGEVRIQVIVLEDCHNITMHAVELNITKNDVSVRHIGRSTATSALQPALAEHARYVPEIDGVELRIRKQYMLESKQFFIIELYDKLIKGGVYEISIRFSGLIQDYLQGFYRSSYQVGNEKRWLASTQFQATDARRAFPCFDEPSLKANFSLKIARPRNMTTVSNMPILWTKPHESLTNYVWDQFAESLPMSTYLVAYAISDFDHISDGNFSAWARKDAIQSARYALSVGPKILKFLEEYFDLPFPLPKLDMIALPDFQAGGMENWGLITYRETTMLFEEGVSATTNKQRIASVVGHELAHQWFGNLVTPSWWSDIWLNEGFASYMEYITVDAIHPDWKTQDQFVVSELQNVFHLDALSSSHKISVEVFNPDEISEIFDRISYGKGSTIIRMMSHFLTSKVFRRGLSKYLKEMSYHAAEQDDLWRFLTNEAISAGLLDRNTTVKEIMDTWTLQVGYPVLTITRSSNAHSIRMEQQRFLFSNQSDDGDSANDDNPLWWIPVTYTTSKELNFENTRPLTWVPRIETYEIDDRNLSTAEWFIFNIQQTGYYRVNYDADNWKAITTHLMQPQKYRSISPANRAQLIDDAMNLARGAYLSYETALNLTRYLKHEMDHVPWKAAMTAFNFIDSMLVNQGDYDILKNYLLDLLENVYKDVSPNNFTDDADKGEDMLKLFKRVEILNMACHLGHRDCILESARHFQNWIEVPNPDTNNPIPPNLRGIVYCTAIQYGNEFEWDFAFQRYRSTSVSTEKELLLSALGCSLEPWILSRYLRRSISGDDIRKQDVYRVFAAVSSNVVGQQIAFDFMRNNWNQIKNYLGSTMSNINAILKFATKRMNSKFFLAELESFVKTDVKDNGRSIQQILEQVRVNVDWMARNYQDIIQWLQREAITRQQQNGASLATH